MSARSRAASWAQKRAIANPFQAEMPTSPPNESCGLANALHQGLVARHDQRGADGDAAVGDRRPAPACRRCRRRAARFPQTPAGRRGAAASGRRIRLAACARPSRSGRTPRFRRAEARRSSARSMSIRRDTLRAVEQDGFLRQPAEMRAACRLQGDVELRRPARARGRPFPPPPWSASAGRPRLPRSRYQSGRRRQRRPRC